MPRPALFSPTELERLKAGLDLVRRRARVEAEAGAPGRMVAAYVAAEVDHILAGHDADISTEKCGACHEALRQDAQNRMR